MKVNYLIELWLIEIVKAIVKLFFNPLFYWFFIYVFILGVIRIKQERYFFGIKIFNLFRSEEHTSELQSRFDIVFSLFLYKKKLVECIIIHIDSIMSSI